ncbi:hypothetical protein Q7P37_004520 [Cladosporium fusiforme]
MAKRALQPPKPAVSSKAYTESKTQRSNNLTFSTQIPKTKAAKKKEKPTEFDSSRIISPLLDPKILERRVMAAKAETR